MQLAGVPKSTLMMIPSGKEGIAETLRLMRALVRDGKKSMRIRQLAVNLTAGLDQKGWGAEIGALFYFVRDKVRFQRDIRDVETLHTADAVLEMGSGDCDDKSVLLASLLESIGHPTRFAAVGFEPGSYEHVFVETRFGPDWLPLDPTEPVEPGWSAPGIATRLTIHN